MPVFKGWPQKAPSWSEMEYFEIIEVPRNTILSFQRHSAKEKLFTGAGNCRLVTDEEKRDLNYGDMADVHSDIFHISAFETPVTLIRVGGNWDSDTGDSGVFSMDKSPEAKNTGDEADYGRNTLFDNHYHDCDEFWIIFKGHALVYSEGKPYEIARGDCVATKRGEHHDIAVINETLHGVYFETTLKGPKRKGHLHNG
ncbi:MAG: cupin domain-containing protein [Acidobacteriota bacterium]